MEGNERDGDSLLPTFQPTSLHRGRLLNVKPDSRNRDTFIIPGRPAKSITAPRSQKCNVQIVSSVYIFLASG